jgi:prepilin-type N-terminal cleavage/methylation domain-containing protein
MNPLHASRRRGFSLVELLVVIAIIGVLMALLLTGISRARMQAQRVACMSNLRQIGLALITYAMDNDGSFPAPGDADYRYPEDWVHWQPDRDVSKGTLMRYLGNHVEVLKCPAGVEERLPYTAGGAYPRTFPAYPFSYSLNARFTGRPIGFSFGANWGCEPCKLNQCIEPSTKILAIEEETTAINDGEWYSGDTEVVINRHSTVSVIHDKGREYGGGFAVDPLYSERGRGVVVYADGRCDFVERTKLLMIGNYDPHHLGGPY